MNFKLKISFFALLMSFFVDRSYGVPARTVEPLSAHCLKRLVGEDSCFWNGDFRTFFEKGFPFESKRKVLHEFSKIDSRMFRKRSESHGFSNP